MDSLYTTALLAAIVQVSLSSRPTDLTLEIVYDKVKSLVQKNPAVSTLMEIGKSVEDRPIYAVKIQKGTSQDATIVVEFGIHARELASPASAIYFLQKLLTNSACEGLIEQIKWYVIPVLNPDGYKYAVEANELWRKNRQHIPSSQCVGIDLNRNFVVGWENRTGSNYYCRETYNGESPISEPESIALKKFLDSLTGEPIKAYVAVHTCAKGIFYPYGYKTAKADNYVELEKVAERMKASIKHIDGVEYAIGPAHELGLGGGGVDEWVYDTYKIPLVYTLELDNEERWDARKCFFPSKKITARLVIECFAALEALAVYIKPGALAQQSRTQCYNRSSPSSQPHHKDLPNRADLLRVSLVLAWYGMLS